MNHTVLCLNDVNFGDYLLSLDDMKKGDLFLVDFWADWCNPCKMFAPIIESIAIEFKDTLKVAKLNIDSSPMTVKKYSIKSIPTLLLIRNSVVLSTKVGLCSKEQLQEWVNTYL